VCVYVHRLSSRHYHVSCTVLLFVVLFSIFSGCSHMLLWTLMLLFYCNPME